MSETGSSFVEISKTIQPKAEISKPQNKIEKLSESSDYKDSVILGNLLEQKIIPDSKVAIFSDIDGTMTNPENFSKGKKALNLTSLFLDKHKVPLVAVSGRDISLIRSGQINGKDFDKLGLPQFPVCIGAVGTEIYVLQKNGEYKLDQGWESHIKEEIGFNRGLIYEKGCLPILEKYKSIFPDLRLRFQQRDSEENVAAWKNDPDNLNKREVLEPQSKKISFNIDASETEMQVLREEFAEMLIGIDRSRVKVIFSSGKRLENGKLNWNIDLIPVDKKDAMKFLAEKFGAMSISAGDSGNDESMINSGDAGLVVGGAKDELVMSARESAKKEGMEKQTRHFTKIVSPEDLKSRILFIEPEDNVNRGPESLLKGLRALYLLSRISKQWN